MSTKEITSKGQEGKVNAYTCGNKCADTIVKHREAGITPMFIDCIHCGTRAISHMYQVPQDLKPDLIAFKPKDKKEWKAYKRYIMEFYRASGEDPSMNDINKAIEATKAHIKAGGVVMMGKDDINL